MSPEGRVTYGGVTPEGVARIVEMVDRGIPVALANFAAESRLIGVAEPMAVMAAKAGKDVCVEKPLGISVEQDQICREVVKRYDDGRMDIMTKGGAHFIIQETPITMRRKNLMPLEPAAWVSTCCE